MPRCGSGRFSRQRKQGLFSMDFWSSGAVVLLILPGLWWSLTEKPLQRSSFTRTLARALYPRERSGHEAFCSARRLRQSAGRDGPGVFPSNETDIFCRSISVISSCLQLPARHDFNSSNLVFERIMAITLLYGDAGVCIARPPAAQIEALVNPAYAILS